MAFEPGEKETVDHGSSPEYSDELRRRVIDQVIERDRKVPDVAKQLGITSPETLRRG
ncbi:MAG TPA: transposase [Acidimicrobiales bacterium]|nr:transposase [Acidimicrobiales bacterium]